MFRVLPILTPSRVREEVTACIERQIGHRIEAAAAQTNAGKAVANLPYARGRTFRTLDKYLAHLERQGAIDLPWWREVAPGVYEWVTRMSGRRPQRATRAELMRRYGFSR